MRIKKYLNHSPLFAINASYEALLPKIHRQLKEDKLNFLQGLVLTALFFEERKDVSPSELAEVFQTSRGNMSHILSHLESLGYVRRGLDDKDARRFRIELRPEGRKKAMSLIRFFDRQQEKFEKHFGVGVTQKMAISILSLREVEN